MIKSESFLGRTRRHLPLVLVLFAGGALSVLVFQMKKEAVSERQRAVFAELAHEYARGFHWELNAHLDAHQSLRDFMLASPEVDRSAFTSFARAALRRAAALTSLQWIPAVRAGEREAWEAGAHMEGLDEVFVFQIGEDGERMPAETREWHYPVFYAEPRQQEPDAAIGFDYGSLAERHQALLRATRNGGLVVSEPGWDSVGESRVLLLLPVFSAEAARGQARGFVSAALDVSALCRRALMDRESPIHIELLDRSVPDSPASIFSTGVVEENKPGARLEAPLLVGGRHWGLVLTAASDTLTPGSVFESWIFLAGGLLFTGFVGLWIRQRQDYVRSVETKVADRTTELFRINLDLQNEMAQRREAEQKLSQSEARFREAFLHAPVGIALLSPRGQWVQVNDALTKMTGFREEELYSQTLADMLHPDEAQNELARMGQMLAGEIETFALEQRFRHKSGRFIWVLFNVSQVRGEDRKLLYFICQILDITKRKKAMEETRRAKEFSENIIKSSSDGILAFDLDGHFTVWNSGMEEMTGIPAAEALGRPPLEVLPFLIETGEDRAFQRVLAGGTVLAAERPFSIPSSGRSGFFAGHYAPLHDEAGGITGGVGVVRDVTEQRKARERLQAFTELLKQRNRELQDFAYVASHDLQEPLRKIRAFGDRLGKKYPEALDEQARDYLRRMQDAARRMQTLIDDLLAFSRISTEASPFATVNLEVVVREVLLDLESRIEETGATVEVGPLPTIEADPTQMRQLFQNLVGNGIKYHRPGTPPRIRIHATKHAAEADLPPLEGAGCLLHVEDNGIGFDEKYLDRIFTVFQRLHGRNEYQGTGVGLAVCRKIAERHNGWVTARSVPGEGSTFIAALPYKQNRKK